MMLRLLRNQFVRRAVLVLLDTLIVLFSIAVSLLIRFEGTVSETQLDRFLQALLWIVPVYLILYLVVGLYRVLWRYAGSETFFRLGIASFIAGAVTIIISRVLGLGLSASVLTLTCGISFGLITVSRYGWRMLIQWKHQAIDSEEMKSAGRRALVVGAGAAGAWVVAQYSDHRIGKPVALVDDAPIKRGLRVQGIPVVGAIQDIPEVVEKYAINDIVIAIPSLKNKRLAEIATLCAGTKCQVKIIARPQSIHADGKVISPVMRRLNASDFLSRDEVALDTESISEYLTDKVVLVTGGGGSIGSEICRQVMRFKPRRVIIFDIYENCAYELYQEMVRAYGQNVPIEICIGSVRERERVEAVFDRHMPSVVFHAAAHKHVPLMETSPTEAVKNNIFGTRNVIEAAARHGVERFVILSTDKAVNPTNVMGATKRVTEMLVQSYAQSTSMKCMAVRFGNVLGSHGSVIPLFVEQIEHGGPITLTHPDITRYFMTIPEAAQLVLQAGGLAEDSAIYVLDMGEPTKIADLAEQLIKFYGYEPGDIAIEITGLRQGEKLYEELMLDEEAKSMKKTSHDLIFVAPPIPMDTQQFWKDLAVLEQVDEQHADETVRMLEQMVSTFHRTPQVADDAAGEEHVPHSEAHPVGL